MKNLILAPLALLILSGCSVTAERVCRHVASIAEEGEVEDLEEYLEGCAQGLEEMEEACPNSFEPMLECIMSRESTGAVAACAGDCVQESIRTAVIEGLLEE